MNTVLIILGAWFTLSTPTSLAAGWYLGRDQ